MKMSRALAVTIGVLVAFGTPASANWINTGAADQLYHRTFCPLLANQLKLAQFDFTCTPSTGTRENIERVLADPRQLGYAQLDVFHLISGQLRARSALSIVRHDDVRQCLYAVTRNPQLTNWGELAANAQRLRFILPAADSDSAVTFQFLRSIDPSGLGRAQQISHTPSIQSAIQQGLSADDTVSLFVAFPDADSAQFALTNEQGGHVVPVIDRAILRQEAAGRKVYFPQETQVENLHWIRSGRKIVTACTPMLVFTGSADNVAQDRARNDHTDLIRSLAALNASALVPEEGVFSKLWKRTKQLSASGTEKLLEATEQARAKARPYTDKAMATAKETAAQAKQATERAGDAARPYLDKSKEAAQKAYDDAMKMTREVLEGAPEPPPKNN